MLCPLRASKFRNSVPEPKLPGRSCGRRWCDAPQGGDHSSVKNTTRKSQHVFGEQVRAYLTKSSPGRTVAMPFPLTLTPGPDPAVRRVCSPPLPPLPPSAVAAPSPLSSLPLPELEDGIPAVPAAAEATQLDR